MGKVIRTLWEAVATLALYDEANRAGFFNKMKPHFVKLTRLSQAPSRSVFTVASLDGSTVLR